MIGPKEHSTYTYSFFFLLLFLLSRLALVCAIADCAHVLFFSSISRSIRQEDARHIHPSIYISIHLYAKVVSLVYIEGRISFLSQLDCNTVYLSSSVPNPRTKKTSTDVKDSKQNASVVSVLFIHTDIL